MGLNANNMVHINSPVVRLCWKQALVISPHSEPGEKQASHGGGGSLGCSEALHVSCLTGEPQQDSCHVLSTNTVSVCVCAVMTALRAHRRSLLLTAHSRRLLSTCRRLARPHLQMHQEPGCIFPQVYF